MRPLLHSESGTPRFLEYDEFAEVRLVASIARAEAEVDALIDRLLEPRIPSARAV